MSKKTLLQVENHVGSKEIGQKSLKGFEKPVGIFELTTLSAS